MTSRILNLTAVLALVACGGADDRPADESPTGGSDPSYEPGPTTGTPAPAEAPNVVSTSPTLNQTGVPADVTIVIEFDQPMDRGSVETAFRSDSLGDVWFAWTPDDRTLTITPVDLLEYAEGVGTEPWEIDPIVYDLRIGTGAESEAGEPLGGELNLSFQTYKRMDASFGIDPTLTGHITDYQWLVISGGPSLRVGDLQSNHSMRGVVTFDLADMPSTAEVVEWAEWSTRQIDAVGDGTVDPETRAYHVTFDAMGEDAFLGFPLTQLGPYSTANDVSVVHDVTDKVQDDVDNRVDRLERSQYRIQFDGDSDNDGVGDYFEYDANAMSLAVRYLAH